MNKKIRKLFEKYSKKIIVILIAIIILEVVYFSNSSFSISSGEAKEGNQFSQSSPTATSLWKEISTPINLEIPKIGVSAFIETVGLDGESRMDVPKEVLNVGWFKLGSKPGEIGNAVIAGHLDTITGAPAVFYNLSALEPGDEIIVTDGKGEKLKFMVKERASYSFNDFPLDQVFGKYDKPRLNLITCEGVFDQRSQNYSHRTVVFSELLEEKPSLR